MEDDYQMQQRKAITLCKEGRFDEAEVLLLNLIQILKRYGSDLSTSPTMYWYLVAQHRGDEKEAMSHFMNLKERTHNRLIDLATMAAAEGFTDSQLRYEFEGLLDLGISPEECVSAADAPVAIGSINVVLMLARILEFVAEMEDFRQQGGALIARLASNLSELAEAKALTTAIDLFRKAQTYLKSGSPTFGQALMNEGIAHHGLAESGLNALQNLREAIALHERARICFLRGSDDFALTLINESIARISLAELGVDPTRNLREAVTLSENARSCFATAGIDFGLTLLNEGVARKCLAELGIEAVPNLKRAITCSIEARECFEPGTPNSGRTQMNEAVARARLAESGLDPVLNLRFAIGLYETASRCFPVASLDLARNQMNEMAARVSLADLGVDSVANLQRAVALSMEARAPSRLTSLDTGRLLINEAAARLSLAQCGFDPLQNCAEAASLYEEALSTFPPESPGMAWALCNLAAARGQVAAHCSSPAQQSLLDESYQKLRSGLEMFERLRSGMVAEQDRIQFLEKVTVQYHIMINLCLYLADRSLDLARADAYRFEAWHWIHRCKSRTLLELLGNIRPRLRPEDQALWDDFQRIGLRLDSLNAKREPDPDANSSEISDRHAISAEEELHAFRAYRSVRHELITKVESYRNLQPVSVPKPDALVEGLRSVDKQILLVEYFMSNEQDVLIFVNPTWLEGPPVVIKVPVQGRQWMKFCRDFHEGISFINHRRRGPTASPDEEPISESKVRSGFAHVSVTLVAMKQLVEPWVQLVDDEGWAVNRVIVSPHYFLNLLPWHAVEVDGQPLIEKWPVTYISSGALVPELANRKLGRISDAYLLGNPTSDLPGSLEEIEEISELMRNEGIAFSRDLGPDACKSTFAERSRTKSVLHAACHSVFDVNDFLRSGLQFSDGRLTIVEMNCTLDLSGTSLVYLSSCDSVRAVPGKTDELMALIRVMILAGAHSVIGTLWPLDDGVGKTFATNFYRAWLVRKRPMAQAFQEATRETRISYPHPAYWAPFVLMGLH